MKYQAGADLGNTALKLCLFSRGKTGAILRLPYQKAPVPAFKRAAEWCRRKGVKEMVLCSVNPLAAKRLSAIMRRNLVRIIPLKRALPPGMKSDYEIASLGMDRLANIIAVRRKYQHRNILVISCGTALTLDVIEGPRHLGGFIAPGLATLLSALSENAALLPGVSPGKSPVAIGRSTQAAIDGGCRLLWLGGARVMAEFVRHCRKEDYALILTGGDAAALRKVFPEAVVDDGLTFDGIRLMAEAQAG